MNISTKSMSDAQLLHLTGFYRTDLTAAGKINQRIDTARLAEFCGVTERAVRNWPHTGLPKRARVQLENLREGEYLPPAWRRAGIKLLHDGVMLRCGNHIPIDVITYWKFIVFGVDWNRVKDIENTVNQYRLTGRVPYNFVQPGADAVNNLMAIAGMAEQARVS